VNVGAGVVEIALGLFFVLGSGPFAVWAKKYNPQSLVRSTPTLAYRVGFLVVGAISVGVGLLSIFGLVHYKA